MWKTRVHGIIGRKLVKIWIRNSLHPPRPRISARKVKHLSADPASQVRVPAGQDQVPPPICCFSVAQECDHCKCMCQHPSNMHPPPHDIDSNDPPHECGTSHEGHHWNIVGGAA